MKKILALALLCVCLLFIGQTVYFVRDGFSLRRLQTDPQVACTIDEQTKHILAQPFSYLARGRQCFVFASADGKYVLKCIRTDKFKVPFWMQFFPEMYQKRLDKITQKKRLIFESFRIAKEELGDLTGTLALHLGKSEATDQKIVISDPLGLRHEIPLDSTLFILQTKRTLWSTAFQLSNVQEKQELLDTFVDLVVQRAQKGIIYRDPNFLPNYAFEGGKTYQIDVGDFRKNPEFEYRKAIRDSLGPLQSWLAKTDPALLTHLNHRLEAL